MTDITDITDKTDKPDKTTKPEPKKKLSRGWRTHVRRMKEDAKKPGGGTPR
jgi:hypothetical protein